MSQLPYPACILVRREHQGRTAERITLVVLVLDGLLQLLSITPVIGYWCWLASLLVVLALVAWQVCLLRGWLLWRFW